MPPKPPTAYLAGQPPPSLAVSLRTPHGHVSRFITIFRPWRVRAARGPTTWVTLRHERSAVPLAIASEQPQQRCARQGRGGAGADLPAEGVVRPRTLSDPYDYSSMISAPLMERARFEFK